MSEDIRRKGTVGKIYMVLKVCKNYEGECFTNVAMKLNVTYSKLKIIRNELLDKKLLEVIPSNYKRIRRYRTTAKGIKLLKLLEDVFRMLEE